MYNVIQCNMMEMLTVTLVTTKAVCGLTVHFGITMLTKMWSVEKIVKSKAHCYTKGVVVHTKAKE